MQVIIDDVILSAKMDPVVKRIGVSSLYTRNAHRVDLLI